MYDPTVGQFLSEDPIGFDGLDENLKRYVRNEVLTKTDPTGLISFGEMWEAIWNPIDAIGGLSASEAANTLAAQIAAEGNLDGAHNGPQDAIRHAIWNALMAQQIGADDAKDFADAHEAESSNSDETRMDQWNNAIGRAIGANNPDASPEMIAVDVVRAYLRGELRVLRRTGSGPVPAGSPLLQSAPCPPQLSPPDPGIPYTDAPGNPYPSDTQRQYPGSPYLRRRTPDREIDDNRQPYPGSPYGR